MSSHTARAALQSAAGAPAARGLRLPPSCLRTAASLQSAAVQHAAAAYGRPGSRRVLAAAKRGGGGSGSSGSKRKSKKSQRDEAAQFEQLMCDWDDAFAADCYDGERAQRIAQLAQDGYKQHGRGFVFVRSRLERQSRKASSSSITGGSAPKGFGAVPKQPAQEGKPLENNPQLRLLDWTAAFMPGSQLDSVGGVFGTPEGGILPDSSSLLASSGDGSGGGGSGGGGSDRVDQGGAALDELCRVMRGMDLAQLRSMVGLLPPPGSPSPTSGDAAGGADPTAAGAGGAGVDANDAAESALLMGGVRAYEPEAGELVILLSARIGGKPALGADIVVAARREDGSLVLEMPDGWEQQLAAAMA